MLGVPCRWLLPVIIGAIWGNDGNVQVLATPIGKCLGLAVTSPNGPDGEGEGPLTWQVVAPAVLTTLPTGFPSTLLLVRWVACSHVLVDLCLP